MRWVWCRQTRELLTNLCGWSAFPGTRGDPGLDARNRQRACLNAPKARRSPEAQLKCDRPLEYASTYLRRKAQDGPPEGFAESSEDFERKSILLAAQPQAATRP
jgi:hypothetical protein